jgi:uncharacterized protein (DUF1015 family)
MPKIKAFCGWRYNPDKISHLASVLAPPYDVISKEQQEALHQKNPYNVIRLILGRQTPRDSAKNNQYTRAKSFLEQWKLSGVLIRDFNPSVYVYLQDYKQEGKPQSRLGFMAAMELNEKAVLRHENTLASPKKDRMALLKEVRTNLSPIFGLFEDREGKVQKILRQSLTLRPSVDATIDGVRHRLFVENRPIVLQSLFEAMETKPMFIADGHHRFEVACQFKNWMRSQFPEKNGAGWNYVMTYFSDCLHNPFKIFPTHRLIRVPKSSSDPLKSLAARGRLQKVGNLDEILSTLSKNRQETPGKAYTFGIFIKKQGFFILTLDKKWARLVKKNPVESLDVAVLHRMIVEPCFKIKAIEKSDAIDFTRDPKEACQRVQKGEFDVAIFLRPTSLSEMLLASKKGLKMPQKSTYFYPKLLSGLVFHSFDDQAQGA